MKTGIFQENNVKCFQTSQSPEMFAPELHVVVSNKKSSQELTELKYANVMIDELLSKEQFVITVIGLRR